MTTYLLPEQAPRTKRDLQRAYPEVRDFTRQLAAPLTPEDCVIQSMPDVSPTRWHLAHTTWFFETFVLARKIPDYEPFHPEFAHLFNSYYETVGDPFPRPRRGLLSRPTLREVMAYRSHVDGRMVELLASENLEEDLQILAIIELGLQHEQQHQELILTDIKHVLSCNPLHPAYLEEARPCPNTAPATRWKQFDESICSIGHPGDAFTFDNELPEHRVLIPSFELATRLVTNSDYVEFIQDGGYERPDLWLADGWAIVGEAACRAPIYWNRRDGEWFEFTLAGLRPLEPAAPASHISYFEADAYARWAGARLPTEFEWEHASASVGVKGHFVEAGDLHPRPAPSKPNNGSLTQMFGDLWEWTSSAYGPYPGYRPLEGALGEYNGKFMCNQFVLRGGSCATPRKHIRRTYRNFFYPQARWQFTGIRLAR